MMLALACGKKDEVSLGVGMEADILRLTELGDDSGAVPIDGARSMRRL